MQHKINNKKEQRENDVPHCFFYLGKRRSKKIKIASKIVSCDSMLIQSSGTRGPSQHSGR
jgi:hypothetical protein